MSTHTPGPWMPVARKIGGYTVDANGDDVVAIAPNNYRHPPRTEANARLIAAAPDLLAALKDIAERKGKTLANFSEMQAMARAAIAKAEGTS